MLQSLESQRVGHNLATEQQQLGQQGSFIRAGEQENQQLHSLVQGFIRFEVETENPCPGGIADKSSKQQKRQKRKTRSSGSLSRPN